MSKTKIGVIYYEFDWSSPCDLLVDVLASARAGNQFSPNNTMQLLFLLSLLSFVFCAEMAFDREYAGVPIFMIYGSSGQPLGLAGKDGRYAVVLTDSSLYTQHGLSFLWRYTAEGQLCAKLADDSQVCLRGNPSSSGKFHLIGSSPSAPLQTGQLDTWDIRCQGNAEPYRCVIQMEGFMVPYKRNWNDMRPLALDLNAQGNPVGILWPMVSNQNQVFAIVPVEL
jgi:hypothetical protein